MSFRCACRRCGSGPGDVAALAGYFARRYAEVNGLPYRPLSRVALLRARRPWLAWQCPRAGEHHPSRRVAAWLTATRSTRRPRSNLARKDHWPERSPGPGSLIGAAAQAAYRWPPGRHRQPGRPAMDDVERDLIIETLSHTLGNRTHAATILGISIRALRNKLHDYGARVWPCRRPLGVAAWRLVRKQVRAAHAASAHPLKVMPASKPCRVRAIEHGGSADRSAAQRPATARQPHPSLYARQ